MNLDKCRTCYKDIRLYLKFHRKWCALTVMIILELFVFACLTAEPNDYYNQYVNATKLEYSNLFAFVFLENIKSALYMVLSGVIPFGLGVVFCTYSVFTGLASTYKLVLPEVGGWKLLLCVLPHGLFELSAICFSILLAVLLCRANAVAVIRLCSRKRALVPLLEDYSALVKSVAFIQVPLVLIAALIESSLSSWIAEIVL